tara:strand:+ start:144 stop:1232 length:1089 start_codon:yes stop_codon:yes gene_type:complete
MFLKIYQKYIVQKFMQMILRITLIFWGLIFIISIFEEVSFFSKTDVSIYFPILLVLLNSFSILYEIFPFIFFISVQFFFIKFSDSDELIAFKSYGLTNLKILQIIMMTSFVSGLIIASLFYNFSAILKFKYVDFKNQFTNDNRYLASITENGIWIKDGNDDQTFIINADKISYNRLHDVEILVLDKNFTLSRTIFSKEIDISNKKWLMYSVKILENIDGDKVNKLDNLTFVSNFDYEKINNLYSNLSSLTFFDLFKLRKDYKSINYSVTEINIHIKSIYSYPFFLTIMSIFSSIIMMNIKHQKPKTFYVVGGIMFSVLIYYLNFFFNALGKNEQIPITLSVWLLIILLSIISLMGITRINEK